MEENQLPERAEETPPGDSASERPPNLLETIQPAAEISEEKPARRPRRQLVTVSRTGSGGSGWLMPFIAWLIALGAVGFAVLLWLNPPETSPDLSGAVGVGAAQVNAGDRPGPTATPLPTRPVPDSVDLPELAGGGPVQALARVPNLLTIIPNRPPSDVIQYQVDFGDAIFSIADAFNITPETVLWANYELLNDNPDFLEVGMELNIPPVNGVYYQWQEGDTLESVAEEFEAEVDDVVKFGGNEFDLAEPEIEAGDWVMIPDGHREFRTWLIPVFDRGNAGVIGLALGPGACSGTYTGSFGSGAFIWPTSNHTLSGNDFWSGHLAIDIGLVSGDPVWASDSGVVVFSGWANGGYGNTVIVDHGNGYQTLYAHLSSATRPCGSSVGPGTTIGLGGSTGNSTGSHLHFEVRFNGGFINPWFVLPPP